MCPWMSAGSDTQHQPVRTRESVIVGHRFKCAALCVTSVLAANAFLAGAVLPLSAAHAALLTADAPAVGTDPGPAYLPPLLSLPTQTAAGTTGLGTVGQAGPTTPPAVQGGSGGVVTPGTHPAGSIDTVAGTGELGGDGDDGPATSATLASPTAVAFDNSGNLDILTGYNSSRPYAAIRSVDGSGTISTVPGSTNPADGRAFLTVGPDGSWFHDDGYNAYRLDTSGVTHQQYVDLDEVAGGIAIDGKGDSYYGSLDGLTEVTAAGTTQVLYQGTVCALAFDAAGEIVFANEPGDSSSAGYSCHGIAKVTLHDHLQQLAAGLSPDINGLTVDSAGTVFVSQASLTPGGPGNTVDKLSGGTLIRVAGTGTPGYSGDGGDAASATLDQPWGLTLDGAGNLLVADMGNQRVREIYGAGAPAVSRPRSGPQIPPPTVFITTVAPDEFLSSVNPAEICTCGQAQATNYPVNTATGEFWHSFSDLATPGRGPALDLTRTYSSALAAQDGVFGHGWTSSYQMSVSADDSGDLYVHEEDGSQVAFVPDDVGGYLPAVPRVLATLTVNADGSLTFKRRNVDTFTFSAAGQLIGDQDANGYTTSLAYDGNGNLTKITDPAGRAFSVTTAGGRITGVHDGSTPQRSLSYSYNTVGDLISVTDPVGNTTTFSYDSSHRMTAMTDPRQQAATSPQPLTNVYDASDRVTAQTDQAGRVTAFDYTTISGATTVTDPSGNVTVYYYSNGLLSQKTTGYGTSDAASTSYGYDPKTFGLVSSTDPDGHTWSSAYDDAGNRTSTSDPLGHGWTATYNGLSEPLTVVDAMGVTTTYTYDGAGNLLTVSTPLLNASGVATATRTVTYHRTGMAGDLTSVTDPNGNTTSYTYDAYGDRTSQVLPPTPENAAGDKTTWGYDTDTGWQTSMVTPRGNISGATAATYTTSFSYDQDGRLVSTRDPLWSASKPTLHRNTSTYDADGNQTSFTDGNGQPTAYTFDADNELHVTTRADGTTLTTDYNPDGTVKDTKDGRGNPTVYTYTHRGQRASTTDALGHTTSVVYDPAGNVTRQQDPGGSCTAATPTACTTFSYDDADELTATTFSDGTTHSVARAYDAAGRGISMTDASGHSTWTYDSLGRITATTNGAGVTIPYTYDVAGNNTGIGYTTTNNVTQAFDAANRLASVKDSLGHTTTFNYNPDSRETGVHFGTTTPSSDSYTYDAAANMTAASLTPSSGATVGLTDSYDGANQLAAESPVGSSVAQAYSYNQLEQLTGSTAGGSARTYGYDPSGNPTKTFTFATQISDAASQLCWSSTAAVKNPSCTSAPAAATTYTYDSRGNRTSQTTGKTTPTTWTWNQSNQLAAVSGGFSDSYTYDGTGLRTKRVSGTTTTKYTWDTASGSANLLSDGANLYLYGPDGAPFEQIAVGTGAIQFLHHDQSGSTRALTSKAGAVTAQFVYDPYGKTTTTSGSATTPLGYDGQYTDADTGLIYLRARYYDPRASVFISKDPLAAKTGAPYGFAGNSPLNESDPTGLESLPPLPPDYIPLVKLDQMLADGTWCGTDAQWAHYVEEDIHRDELVWAFENSNNQDSAADREEASMSGLVDSLIAECGKGALQGGAVAWYTGEGVVAASGVGCGTEVTAKLLEEGGNNLQGKELTWSTRASDAIKVGLEFALRRWG